LRITIKNIYWLARGKIMSNAEIIVVVIFVVIIALYLIYHLLFSRRSKDKDFVGMDEMMIERTLKNGKKK